MKFHCEHCAQSIDAPDELAGTKANCPACGETIAVPSTKPKKKLPPLSEDALTKLEQSQEQATPKKFTAPAPSFMSELAVFVLTLWLFACCACGIWFAGVWILGMMGKGVDLLDGKLAEHYDAKEAEIRRIQSAEEREWNETFDRRKNTWQGREILNVEVVNSRTEALPTSHTGGILPMRVPPRYKYIPKQYKATYSTGSGATKTETLDYDPSYHAR